MAAAYIEIESVFADDTTRKFELGPFDTDAAVVQSAQAKANIAAVNSEAAVIGSVYLSNGGASFVSIKGATITYSDIREINLND